MIDPVGFETILVERSEPGVLTVTLNRPERLNAMNRTMHDEIVAVLARVRDDEDVKVVVVTGAGRGFCSGADIKERSEHPGDRAGSLLRQRQLVRAMVDLDQPIVSAVRGPAIGSGLALALMADLSIVAEDARLSDANVHLGVVSGDHAVLSWPLLCGMARAKFHLLLGDEMTGSEAERIGLVSRAVASDVVVSTAQDVARRLAGKSPSAVRGTKSALNNWYRMSWPFNDTAIAFGISGMLDPDEP